MRPAPGAGYKYFYTPNKKMCEAGPRVEKCWLVTQPKAGCVSSNNIRKRRWLVTRPKAEYVSSNDIGEDID